MLWILYVLWVAYEIITIIGFLGGEYSSRKIFIFDILVPFGSLFRKGKEIYKNMKE